MVNSNRAYLAFCASILLVVQCTGHLRVSRENNYVKQTVNGEAGLAEYTGPTIPIVYTNTETATKKPRILQTFEGSTRLLSDSEMEVYPYSAIGMLVFGDVKCTASLVSTDLILTARSCIALTDNNYVQGNFFQSSYSARFFVGDVEIAFKLAAWGSSRDGIAYLQLITPIGESLGWFGQNFEMDISNFVSKPDLFYAGYQVDWTKIEKSVIEYVMCSVSSVSIQTETIYHSCDIPKRSAGALVFDSSFEDNPLPMAVAVHLGNDETKSNQPALYAKPLSRARPVYHHITKTSDMKTMPNVGEFAEESGTGSPTPAPTDYPTPSPTKYPTPSPTDYPTPSPTKYPTPSPTDYPTPSPTDYPTPGPTKYPTPGPTKYPTPGPTKYPTPGPTKYPTPGPTKYPTPAPTKFPTPAPTDILGNNPVSPPSFVTTSYPTPPPDSDPNGCAYNCPAHAFKTNNKFSCPRGFRDCGCELGYEKQGKYCVSCRTYQCPEFSFPKRDECVKSVNDCKCQLHYKFLLEEECIMCSTMQCPPNSVPDYNVQCVTKLKDCECVKGYKMKDGECIPK